MATSLRKPIIGPSAWRPADFPRRAAYTVELGDAHFSAFDAALGVNRAAGRAAEDIALEDFALRPIARDVAAWRDEVLRGRGFVVLRGLTRDRCGPDGAGAIFRGVGTHVGRAVSQGSIADRIGHVPDVAGEDARERAYRSSRELTLHTDRCDVIGMQCVISAMRGGVS